MCENGKAECSSSTFNGVRKGWHIDGCASDFIPGVTDHYGTIHNFNMLIGCLLSDVPEPMSGELCCYPGSHVKMANYLQEKGRLNELRTKGNAVLPTGNKTDDIFERPVFHGTGKAGDLFIANYLTAHFIAPNTAPDIRYAVYFRVKGPRFKEGKGSEEGLLDPWCDWVGLDQVSGEIGETKQPTTEGPEAPNVSMKESLVELVDQHDMNQHLASADYSHTQKQ